MSMSPDAFVSLLVQAHPKSAALVSEHFADYDELLIHLLLADVLRLCVSEFHDADPAVSDQLLALVDDALPVADERLRNAIEVSFVEDAGRGDGETPEFMASWPAGLLEILHRDEENY